MRIDFVLIIAGDSSMTISEANPQEVPPMLNWAITFFIVALIAAVLGFTGVAVAAAGVAKLLFVVFLVLFLVSLATHFGRRSSV